MGAPFVRSGKQRRSWPSDALPVGQPRSSVPAFPDGPSPPGPSKWWTVGREKMRENRRFDNIYIVLQFSPSYLYMYVVMGYMSMFILVTYLPFMFDYYNNIMFLIYNYCILCITILYVLLLRSPQFLRVRVIITGSLAHSPACKLAR